MNKLLNKKLPLWAVVIGVFLTSLAWKVGEAMAHGPHNSAYQPDYDCYNNPDGPDTRGDLVVTHDLDLNVYVVWKCVCVPVHSADLVCYWKKMGTYVKRWKAVRRLRELETERHGAEYLKKIRVTWSAFHRGVGCNTHYDYKYVIQVRRRG